MKKATILVPVISSLGAMASMGWFFLDPGLEPFVAGLVCLTAVLVESVNAQIRLTKLQDEDLSKRLDSIRELKQVVDDIPRGSADELLKKLDGDTELCRSLTSRMVRLFGLRRELIPNLEPELIDLIDHEFEKFYIVEVGHCTFRRERLHEFAVFAEKITGVVRAIEKSLTDEHRKRFGYD